MTYKKAELQSLHELEIKEALYELQSLGYTKEDMYLMMEDMIEAVTS